MSAGLLRRVFPRDVHHVAGLHEMLAREMPAHGRVLDLGCGANTDLERYRTPDREVWGTDFQTHSGLRHCDWFRLLASDGTIPFSDSHFDIVAAVMVLEHVADPVAFFREVSRVLRPGGRFIGHTISGTHYVSFLRRLFGLFPHRVSQLLVKRLYGREEEDTFPTHYRLNTARQLREAAQRTGLVFRVVRRYADPGYFRFAKPVEMLAILADRVLDGLCPGWGRLYLTVVLEKPAR